MSEFRRRQVQNRDSAIFQNAVKLYFFVNHIKHSQLHEQLKERFAHSANIVYSMLRGYLENGKFQIEYLDFLNDEITHWVQEDKSLFEGFHIMPEEIDEIELSGKVPLQFRDAETGEQMRMVYYPEESVCDYNVINLN